MYTSMKKGRRPNTTHRPQILWYCQSSKRNQMVNKHPRKWKKSCKKTREGNITVTPARSMRNSKTRMAKKLHTAIFKTLLAD